MFRMQQFACPPLLEAFSRSGNIICNAKPFNYNSDETVSQLKKLMTQQAFPDIPPSETSQFLRQLLCT